MWTCSFQRWWKVPGARCSFVSCSCTDMRCSTLSRWYRVTSPIRSYKCPGASSLPSWLLPVTWTPSTAHMRTTSTEPFSGQCEKLPFTLELWIITGLTIMFNYGSPINYFNNSWFTWCIFSFCTSINTWSILQVELCSYEESTSKSQTPTGVTILSTFLKSQRYLNVNYKHDVVMPKGQRITSQFVLKKGSDTHFSIKL